MKLLIQILGILIVLEGVLFILQPNLMQRFITFFVSGKRLYYSAIGKIIFAVMFLIGGSECKFPVVIIVVGILALTGGIFPCAAGIEQQKRFLGWWLKKSSVFSRICGIIVVLFGALILYSA